MIRIFFTGLLIVLLSSNISGLSCGGDPEPMVGSLENISSDKIEVSVSEFFDVSRVRGEESYSISKYEEIAKNSINNEIKENTSLTYRITELNQSIINKSEVMVSGPPTRACGYRFRGFLEGQKGMQAAIVDGAFETYKYRDTFINTSAGKNITCENVEDPACNVSVEFKVGDEEFEIVPNQTYRPESKAVEEIELLEAKKNFDWEWNTETYSKYIIYFSPEDKNMTEGTTETEWKDLEESIRNQFFSILRIFNDL